MKLADGLVVKTYEGEELAQCRVPKLVPFQAEDAIFNGRDYDILFLWPALDPSAPLPARFSHRLHFADHSIVEGGEATVTTATTLIAPPVRGDRWWAANGPSNRVTTGQVIGKLGNSGNSTGPHLHFHLCNRSEGYFSEGLPFSFANYEVLGTLAESDVFQTRRPWTPDDTPQRRSFEMPLREQVLRL